MYSAVGLNYQCPCVDILLMCGYSPHAVFRHPGVAMELVLRLSSVTIRTHRPTVAALMTLGLDLLAVLYLLDHAGARRATTTTAAGTQVRDCVEWCKTAASSSDMVGHPSAMAFTC
jgi:hypothetical protein